MKKIDRETVNRILDSADIVEVVSDFVTLRRRGANYIGLCPFHNERTPSFSVSKSKGICKCFSCGKGGSPVNFLMELEQMSYNEALRWLAKKYNIEIHEHEESEEEKRKSDLREALFAVNAFAASHFEKNLTDTDDGRDIGLSYFAERGLSLETIKKFRLGYALEKFSDLSSAALRNGFLEENLVRTGLVTRNEHGNLSDRFRGRVIFPVLSLSGKIVAFGGRTLKTEKTVAKYVNSPESEIYSKSRELYGLFQAKRSIVKEDKCILVEGYMDVLSMSQSGIENVVASSGTSLTANQINLIHRFTDNVTVIYDADAAGIKASLRGIDMLLSEGMNVKVVLFPEGEDPDSYARTHTREELALYLKDNETDFIKFKTSVLMADIDGDPLKRSRAIADIMRSIAVIPDSITRQIYIEESSRAFNIDAKILALEVSKGVAKIAEDAFNVRQRSQAAKSLEGAEVAAEPEKNVDKTPVSLVTDSKRLYRFEYALTRYLVRYGMLILGNSYADDGSSQEVTVLDYVLYELQRDGISLSDETLARLLDRIVDRAGLWQTEFAERKNLLEAEKTKLLSEGLQQISTLGGSPADITREELKLQERINAHALEVEKKCRRLFFEKDFLSDPDDSIRKTVTEMADDKYHLSKLHSKYAKIETEEDRLPELVPRAVFELKDAILGLAIENLAARLKEATSGNTETQALMAELMEKMKIRAEFAHYLGERIVMPPSIRK